MGDPVAKNPDDTVISSWRQVGDGHQEADSKVKLKLEEENRHACEMAKEEKNTCLKLFHHKKGRARKPRK